MIDELLPGAATTRGSLTAVTTRSAIADDVAVVELVAGGAAA
ncbi:MAG TPA: hypothetical protein VJ646_06835 [Candidatus Binatia bacterium]|nr:hypothetical protein [Candidatus Binatia bacterium]